MEWLVNSVILSARLARIVLGPLLPAPKVVDPPSAAIHYYAAGQEPPDLLVTLIRQQVRLYG
jgi:hypothetical protein